MADVKISGLPANPQAVAGTDLVALVQSVTGTLTTVKAQMSALLTYINANAQLADSSQVTGLGTAATKAASNVAYSTLAALTGASTPGGTVVVFSSDEDGSLQSSGVSGAQILQSTNDLSDLFDVYSGRKNIFAQQNNGFSQPDLTGADLILSNPAPTTLNISNNNGTTSVQLPSPNDIDGSVAWQPGTLVLWDNTGGSNGVPIKQFDGSGIMTLLAGGAYLMYMKNTGGDVAFLKVV